MASADRTYDDVKKNPALISVTTAKEKIALYDGWTAYQQDMDILDYKGPCYAANSISKHFSGDRETAIVLDVACGTGEVAKEMKKIGFNHFVGVDGSKSMMEVAQKTGLYRDLKLCVLGEQDLPVEKGSFDLALMIGALSVDMVCVRVLRQICEACKTGGFIVMTTRHGPDDLVYTAELHREQKQMEADGLWSCVNITRMENWLKSITAEPGFIPGSVYIYRKL